MAIDKKLIRFKTKENFMSANGVNGNVDTPTSGKEEDGTATYGQIRGTSIVFIEDSKEIWTHGNLYKSANWSVLTSPIISFSVKGVGEYTALKGMTWYEWCMSEYNTRGFWTCDYTDTLCSVDFDSVEDSFGGEWKYLLYNDLSVVQGHESIIADYTYDYSVDGWGLSPGGGW